MTQTIQRGSAEGPALAAEVGRWTVAGTAAFVAGCLVLNTLGAPPFVALLAGALVAWAGTAYVLRGSDAAYGLLVFVIASTVVVQWTKHGAAGLLLLGLLAAMIAGMAASTLAGIHFTRQVNGVGR